MKKKITFENGEIWGEMTHKMSCGFECIVNTS